MTAQGFSITGKNFMGIHSFDYLIPSNLSNQSEEYISNTSVLWSIPWNTSAEGTCMY